MNAFYSIALIVLIGLSGPVMAQDAVEEDSIFDQPLLALQKRTESDRVILRWAPTNYSLFRHASETGYRIQRRAYSTNPEVEFTQATDLDGGFKDFVVVKPWAEDEWRSNATDSSDIYAGVAMQILLGGEIKPKGNGEMNDINSYYEDQQRKFAYGLIAADLSPTAALGLGLRFEDTDVKQGYFYEYRIMLNELPEGFKADTAWVFADMTRPYKAKQVRHAFLEASDKSIGVYWTRHNDQFFTAYDVERSEDKVTWTKLNDRPWMTSLYTPETPNFFIDSLAENDKTYYYRIIGYTAFGDQGSYSDVLSDKGVDLTPPAPAWGVKAEDMGGYVAINWEASPNEVDFDGFYVERSDAPNGHFERISEKLPADARDFADLMPAGLSSNYYRIASVDTKGNESKSFSDLGYLVDSMPPAMPTGLIGTIDTNGRVELDWTPGPEADIIGYRVYWSNNKETEFTQLLGEVIPGVNYVDSIEVKTLNEEIYYRIAAVDHRYNHSVLSDILTLKKPDLVPPAEPLIYDYHVNESSARFKWYPSSSADVIKQEVWRMSEGVEWTMQRVTSDTTYEDKEVEQGKAYSYKVVVYDDASNRSESQVLNVTVVDNASRQSTITASFKVEQEVAQLSWSAEKGEAKYVVYRKRGDMQTKLASVYAPEISWKDADYEPGDDYLMRVVYPDGDESQLITFKRE
ncbi:MAG: hypothetical protein JJ975_04270 [Bacteroidia bacterium]|nr:hypothetical protein [Bacteroidia bacterium]